MVANYGGTKICNPLKWAFENSIPTAVFFLTDSKVYNIDQIVEFIKSSKEKKKGYTQFILEDTLLIETNSADKPIIGFFKDKATPLPDTQLIFTNIKIQQAPFLIPPIYPGLSL
ncbi:vWA-like protein [Gigaspora margarita]|uniref:VWA-like protein n=1 Tax=Gigaspora margarita TaxID=4874 RepID=A0A8H4ENJ5_GIGMA|nr:vWA-like protein [Gigaspora margarita]